jgi:phosphatidylglycerophosphate synthase
MIVRIQDNIVASAERTVLTYICRRLPGWVTPDRLTLVGLLGGAVVLVGYALSNLSLGFLWLAILGYGLHWFGDSLDGSLARFRGIERKRYGYFVDHSADALGNFMIALGLGFTAAVRLDAALFAFVGYLLLSIYVFLKRSVLDEMQLSFLAMGPTELRIILIILTVLMPWLGSIHFALFGESFTPCDGIVLFGGVTFLVIFIFVALRTAEILRRQDVPSRS